MNDHVYDVIVSPEPAMSNPDAILVYYTEPCAICGRIHHHGNSSITPDKDGSYGLRVPHCGQLAEYRRSIVDLPSTSALVHLWPQDAVKNGVLPNGRKAADERDRLAALAASEFAPADHITHEGLRAVQKAVAASAVDIAGHPDSPGALADEIVAALDGNVRYQPRNWEGIVWVVGALEIHSSERTAMSDFIGACAASVVGAVGYRPGNVPAYDVNQLAKATTKALKARARKAGAAR